MQRIPRELSTSRHPTMHRILIESRVRRRETLVLSCGRLRLSTREEERREGSETPEGEARCERRVSRPRFSFPFINERPRGPFVRANFTPTLMAISLRWLRDTIAPAARGRTRTNSLSEQQVPGPGLLSVNTVPARDRASYCY